MKRNFIAWGAFLLTVSTLSFAQSASTASASTDAGDTGNSLVAVARNAKASNSTHAKKVFTDEDMEATAGPLPLLKMEGPENADDVVTAITKYQTSHTPDETEQAVHIWFDRYDSILAAVIQENLEMQTLRAANMSNGNELCRQSQDYQQCQNRQWAEQRGAQNDQLVQSKNSNTSVRIQHAFMKVRNGLQAHNLHYSWFKIRTTNNIDIF